MSELDEVVVTPKPIERHKKSTCLKVFSKRTHSALLHHPSVKDIDGIEDTAIFSKFYTHALYSRELLEKYQNTRL